MSEADGGMSDIPVMVGQRGRRLRGEGFRHALRRGFPRAKDEVGAILTPADRIAGLRDQVTERIKERSLLVLVQWALSWS